MYVSIYSKFWHYYFQVNFTIAEIRDSLVLARTGHDSTQSINRTSEKHTELDEPETSLATRSNSSWAELDREKKAARWFSWKRQRMSVRPIQSKDEPLIKKTRSWNFGNIVDSVFPSSNQVIYLINAIIYENLYNPNYTIYNHICYLDCIRYR